MSTLGGVHRQCTAFVCFAVCTCVWESCRARGKPFASVTKTQRCVRCTRAARATLKTTVRALLEDTARGNSLVKEHCRWMGQRG